jgi:hypothetical protein
MRAEKFRMHPSHTRSLIYTEYFSFAHANPQQQAIAASRWIMLEMILLGALLLYVTVGLSPVFESTL